MLFTILIWVLALLIYLSSPKNKANKCCAINAAICSLGTLKEYYLDLVPLLEKQYSQGINPEIYTAVYSVMTAIVYHLAMPTGLLFMFYFCSYDKRYPHQFKLLKVGIFLPSLILIFIYNPLKTTWYQHNDRVFWYVFTAYNVGYGIYYTYLMLSAIFSERNSQARKQKRLVAILLLPAIWFCLITTLIIHSLGISELFKLWKGNILILGGAILFYIVMAFKEGIMGIRLRSENYRWNSDMLLINKNVQFTGHLIKNETAKIEWCLENLQNKYLQSSIAAPEEILIIRRSITHLKNFNLKATLYSGSITINEHKWPLKEILTQCVELNRNYLGKSLSININYNDEIDIYCDRTHLVEVLNNLIQNAADAVMENGVIDILCYQEKKRPYYCIAVHDNGPEIKKEIMDRLFEPYFTTKKTDTNFGLGLSYCMNVIKKHNGEIEVESNVDNGTTFSVYIPLKRIVYPAKSNAFSSKMPMRTKGL